MNKHKDDEVIIRIHNKPSIESLINLLNVAEEIYDKYYLKQQKEKE
ncbi:MAG: hypothetical protein LLF98_01920 [Clostridium sp.]|nr:hypothetical protein [Clostridium sp.]MCE5220038.1 hypothetical protein [Clostridium sp.]